MKTLLILSLLIGALCCVAQNVDKESATLTQIRADYHKEMRRLTASLTEEYLRSLERLKKELGKGGDVEGMIAVQKEIDNVRASEPGDNSFSFIGIWKVGSFTDEFKPNGTFVCSDSNWNGKWKYNKQNDTLTIFFGNNTTQVWFYKNNELTHADGTKCKRIQP